MQIIQQIITGSCSTLIHTYNYIVKGISDPAVKHDRLIMSCKGEARSSIAFCTLCDSDKEGFFQARKIFDRQYDRKHVVIDLYLDKLTNRSPRKANDFESLKQLAMDVCNCEIACHGFMQTDLDKQQIIGCIFRRLLHSMQEGFLSSVSPQLE